MRVIQSIIQLLQAFALTASAYVLPMVLATISTIEPPQTEVIAMPVRGGTFAARVAPEPAVTPSDLAPQAPARQEAPHPAPTQPRELARVVPPAPAEPTSREPSGQAEGTALPALHDHCVATSIAGVEQLSARRYRVDRELVDFYTRHPAQARQSATLSWSHEDGRIDGFKLGRIRCGSLLHALGLRSEDIVHSVNGHDITSLASAVLAASRVHRQDTLRVRVSRDGEIVKMRYKLS